MAKLTDRKIAVITVCLGLLGVLGDIMLHAGDVVWNAASMTQRIAVMERVINGDGATEKPLNERMTHLEDATETVANNQVEMSRKIDTNQLEMSRKLDILIMNKSATGTIELRKRYVSY